MAAKTASLSVNIIADAAKAKAGLKEAETAFGKFRREVNESQGAMGKFQTVAGGAFSFVKQNAMNFATAAGAAVGAFVVKSVNDFQNLVLSIGKFSDATGLSMEQASRLVEVAGDVGIEMATLEKSLGFMNKTLGNNAEAFKDLGVQIVYTSGGAVDANKTFLNVIDRLNKIQDPAARAAAGAKLLGRGWQEMAELIGMGSAELTKSLNQVESTKVFNEEQLRNAKELRDAFDELKGRVEGFSNALGDRLVPILTDATDLANTFFDVFKTEMPIIGGTLGSRFADAIEWTLFRPIKLGSAAVDLLSDAFGRNEDAVGRTIPVTAEMARVWADGYRAMINGRTASDELTIALQRQETALVVVKGALDRLKASLNLQLAMNDARTQIDSFQKKWADAMASGKVNSQEFQNDLLRIKIMLLNLAEQVMQTATAVARNQLRILVDTGQLERAYALLQAIKQGGEVKIPSGPGSGDQALMAQKNPPAGKKPGGVWVDGYYLEPGLDFSGFKADGGVIKRESLAVVGEAGPEVIIPLTDPRRAGELMRQTGLDRLGGLVPMGAPRNGGDTYITVKVDAGLVSSPDQVGAQIIEAIRRAERRSGQVFASV